MFNLKLVMLSVKQLPLVVVVGRPNVGKSALFNRLIGRKKAIVDKTPGVTRDRIYEQTEIGGRSILLVDTGGLAAPDSDPLARATEQQALQAIEKADLILFVTDARAGALAGDFVVADLLRRAKAPVLLVANKVDSESKKGYFTDELIALGFGEPFEVSALHGLGIKDLEKAIADSLPRTLDYETSHANVPRIAIVGRQNAGKSSLLNAILGDERVIVSDKPGTTRDPVDTEIEFAGTSVVLVDTAGIKQKSHVQDPLEGLGILKAFQTIDRADCVLLVVDLTVGVTDQDKEICGRSLEVGKSVVVVYNKIDTVKSSNSIDTYLWDLHMESFHFAKHCPYIGISAKTGENVHKVIPTALEVVERRSMRLPTAKLNAVVRDALTKLLPPVTKGRRLKVSYVVQAYAPYPTIVLFVNDPELLPTSYQRYLESQIRESFGLFGTPIKFVLRPKR